MTFNEFGLSQDLLRGLDELGFVSPTPIQQQSIPQALQSDRDLIALAQTGTGKTAAFSLPIVEQIDQNSHHPQAIILCPTRELCLQIHSDIQKFTRYLPRIQALAVYGGAPIHTQIRALERGVQIVVGTPGRVVDLIHRKKLKLQSIQWVVLDEADEMLNMGFKDDLDLILAETPSTKQTFLFSATMPRPIEEIAKKYMRNALRISVAKESTGADNIVHEYYMVHARDRYQALRRLADLHPTIYGIVFCRTKRETTEVADQLIQDHYSAEALHGDLSQMQRDDVMQRFRKKKIQLLVATDVAARGIDVNDLTHVINDQLPENIEAYVHRSGRTGRAGSSGHSFSIIHLKELGKIRAIERKLNKKFIQRSIPTGKDICEKQLLHLLEKVREAKPDAQIEPYLPVAYETFHAFDREALIKQFLSIEFNRFLEHYGNAPNINADTRSSFHDRMTGGTFRDEKIVPDRDRCAANTPEPLCAFIWRWALSNA
ncbi:DEAD/DEAH box helicase [Candidatus Peregrinibacteria bacterium]|nr:MAG: DEAD/DEAH box helicase [Candidatus Peregrinibacteria bacterium]